MTDLLLIIFVLSFSSITIIIYTFYTGRLAVEVHLPKEVTGQSSSGDAESSSGFKQMLRVPAHFIDRLIHKLHLLPIEIIERIKDKLVSAGKPMNVSQFIAFKIVFMLLLPFLIYTFMPKTNTNFIIGGFAVGLLFPDYWLKSKIKRRQSEISRDLPHVIELMNICVSSGLDFMVAVNKVIQEFRYCPLIEEFGFMTQEIQMGSSRRDALRNFSKRINSADISSFVLTLLQADRMGTPIGKILKAQAEEMRVRRFQRGEEQALKAPIKLLFPLLFFIMPVVLVIVAGPIIIQFLYGGFKLG